MLEHARLPLLLPDDFLKDVYLLPLPHWILPLPHPHFRSQIALPPAEVFWLWSSPSSTKSEKIWNCLLHEIQIVLSELWRVSALNGPDHLLVLLSVNKSKVVLLLELHYWLLSVNKYCTSELHTNLKIRILQAHGILSMITAPIHRYCLLSQICHNISGGLNTFLHIA